MKITELTNNVLITLNNEESELLTKFKDTPTIAKNKLDDREQVIANNLTIKDILQRINEAGKIYYRKRTS